MATLERREQTPGKVTYRVRWWADGKQRSKSFKNYADGRRFKAGLEGDLVNSTYIDPKEGVVTLSAFAEAHLDTIYSHLRESSRMRVDGAWRVHIKPAFGHLPLTAITTGAVQRWIETSPVGDAATRKNAATLRTILNHAVRLNILKANPVSNAKLPVEPKHEQMYLTRNEVNALASSIHPRFKAMVLIAVYGGLRLGEICGLQRRHIVTESNQIHVTRTMLELKSGIAFGPPKTKSSVRVVTLPRSVMVQIKEHLDTYVPDDIEALVFTGVKGGPIHRPWFYTVYWLKATQGCDLPGLRFHDLRHTFVALWVAAGRNAKEVSRAAGHSSVAFTLDRYGHLYDTDSDGLADELDTMLGLMRPQTVLRLRPRQGVPALSRRAVRQGQDAVQDTPGRQ